MGGDMPPPVVIIGNDIHGPLCEMGARYAATIVDGLGIAERCVFSIESHQTSRTTFGGVSIPRSALGRPVQLLRLLTRLALLKKSESRVLHFVGNGNPELYAALSWFSHVTGRRALFTPFGSVRVPRLSASSVLLCTHEKLCSHYSPPLQEARVRALPPFGSDTADTGPRSWGEGRIVFCSVPVKASELTERGVPFLLDAVAAARHAGLRCSLTILNRYRHLEGPLRELIHRSPLQDTVLETGIVTDMQQRLREYSVLTIPYLASHLAQVPQSAVEALSAGVPCLVPKHLAVSDDILGYRAGAVYSCEASFTSALAEIRDNYSECSSGARRLAREQFGKEKLLERLEAIYYGLSAERQPAAAPD